MDHPALDRIESLVNGLTSMQEGLSSRLEEIAQAPAEGISDSGLVTVQARSDGRIVDVRLDPQAMRLYSEDLAAEFAQAATRAQDAAAATAKDQVRSLLTPPDGPGHRSAY